MRGQSWVVRLKGRAQMLEVAAKLHDVIELPQRAMQLCMPA